MKPLIHPFTYQECLTHPSTKNKIKWCKEIGTELDKQRKYGMQLNFNI